VQGQSVRASETVIRGGPGRLGVGTLCELWLFREVLVAFVRRQVKVKYRQAAVGVGWALLQPVLTAALFALFLGRLARVPSDGAPYLLFALAGLVAWSYFSAASTSAIDSLITDQALVRKVYFPRELPPLAALGAGLVDLVPAMAVLLLVAMLFGVRPGVTWIGVLAPAALLALSAAALSLPLAAINVYYRDVRYALPFVLQLGLFVSPVIYPLSVIPAQWRDIYTIANPVAAAIDGFRRTIVHGTWPDFERTCLAALWALILLLAGYALFKRLERSFADRL
jgi:lipopolysaccharide transport system permease protein